MCELSARLQQITARFHRAILLEGHVDERTKLRERVCPFEEHQRNVANALPVTVPRIVHAEIQHPHRLTHTSPKHTTNTKPQQTVVFVK